MVSNTGQPLGFVFAHYLITIKELRELIDELLKCEDVTPTVPPIAGHGTIATIIAGPISSKLPVEFTFIDKNGWPVKCVQEDKLSLLDLIINHNVCVHLKENKVISSNVISDNQHHHHVQSSNHGMDRKPITALDHKYLTSDISNGQRFMSGQLTSPGDQYLSIKQSTNDSIVNDTVDGSSIMRRGSKKGTAVSRPLVRRKTDKLIRLKSSKSSAKPIMLSYARQEAAQHALDLKEELVKLGFQVYLVINQR